MTHTDVAIATLLNGICEGTILAAVMWIVLKMLPRLNSTTRFMVLWLTLLAVVALPIALVSLRVHSTTATGFASVCNNGYSCGPDFCSHGKSLLGIEGQREAAARSSIHPGTKP